MVDSLPRSGNSTVIYRCQPHPHNFMDELTEKLSGVGIKDDATYVGGTTRADGSVRRVVKVRPGYLAPENVPKYIPRAKRTDPTVGRLVGNPEMQTKSSGEPHSLMNKSSLPVNNTLVNTRQPNVDIVQPKSIKSKDVTIEPNDNSQLNDSNDDVFINREQMTEKILSKKDNDTNHRSGERSHKQELQTSSQSEEYNNGTSHLAEDLGAKEDFAQTTTTSPNKGLSSKMAMVSLDETKQDDDDATVNRRSQPPKYIPPWKRNGKS
jgi:hypothetical protein